MVFRNVIVKRIVGSRRNSFVGLDDLMGELPELGRDCSFGLIAELERQRDEGDRLQVQWGEFRKWKCTKCDYI